jgi:hypothetical protein
VGELGGVVIFSTQKHGNKENAVLWVLEGLWSNAIGWRGRCERRRGASCP